MPLRGVPEGLELNLRRALTQETPPGTEWRFCVESLDDPAADIARRVIARAALADARLVVAGPPRAALAKVHNLIAGIDQTRGTIVVLLDADAWLPHARYLDELTAPLSEASTGLVTAYPWYVGARNPAAALLGAMINADVLGTFAIRAAWGGRRFANGTCMAMRRDALEAIGGFAPLARRMLMDSALADAIAATGRAVRVHHEPVRIRRVRAPLAEVLEQAHRWHVSMRRGLHPATYAALGWLRSASLLALLAWACAPRSPWTLGLLAAVAMNRLVSTASLAALAGTSRGSMPALLAQLPADLLAPFVWLRALWDDRVTWQGTNYRIGPGARLEPIARKSGGRRWAPVADAIRFARLESWGVQLPILVSIALGLALAAGASPASYVPALLRVALAQSLLMLGGYVFNDLCDVRGDALKHGARAARGLALKRVIVPIALSAGIAVTWPMGALARAIVLVQVAAGLAYSAPGVRLKERGVLGVLAAALLQRLPAAALIAIAHPPAPALAALGGLWLAAVGVRFILEHQIEDLDVDVRAGVRTWAIRAGRTRAAAARDVAGRAGLALALAGGALLLVAGPRPGAWLAATLWIVLDRVVALLFARRYRATPALAVRTRRSPPEDVHIFGAGLAGLVAASRLAERGHRVEVHEQRLRLGGMAESAPSVHSLQGAPEALERAIELPIADLFEPIAWERVRLGEQTFSVTPRHVNVERGGRRAALDQRLLELALERGVVVRFASPLRPGRAEAGAITIVATGLGRVLERAFGIAGDPVEGWVTTGPHLGRATLTTFRRRCYGPGYGYVAARGDLRSALLFARGTLPAEARAAFERDLATDLGWHPGAWTRLHGMVPIRPRLECGGVILAGTAAGLLDPFYLSGVEAALISGVVAAEAVADREAARRRFERLTRGFALKRALAARAWSPAAPAAGTLAVAILDRALGRVGRAA